MTFKRLHEIKTLVSVGNMGIRGVWKMQLPLCKFSRQQNIQFSLNMNYTNEVFINTAEMPKQMTHDVWVLWHKSY